MRLYFFRHAEAEDYAGNDFDRQLTQRGITRTKRAAKVIQKLFEPDVIYSSPRVRAYQTAEILAGVLNMEIDIQESLDFSFDVEAVVRLARNWEWDSQLVFVGHNPSMSEVVEEITGASLNLKKGGLARVDLSASGAGELVYLITPKVFDTLSS